MKPRDARVEVSGHSRRVHAVARHTPSGVSQALSHAETACSPPAHTPQSQPKADYALPRQVPPV